MTRYLFAAEADKIQDFIFRSSRLREVVGASQLLTRFCKEVPEKLVERLGGIFYEDKIICDGGSFIILFDKKETAVTFGEYLSETYRIATGGSLTVAEPVEIKEPFNDNFAKASKQVELNLRQAKRKKISWHSVEHMPYMAICTSCGIGLAKGLNIEGDKQVYLCQSCINKEAESKQEGNMVFLKSLYKLIADKDKAPLHEYSWPGKGDKDPTEDMANYDPNRYVAYLVADGDSMGEVFGSCPNKKTMVDLSNELTAAICRALARPTRVIMNNQLDQPYFIPILPLILGGDEVFTLIPAPWALDFTLNFCQAFEEEMVKVYKDIELYDCIPSPTISATVVICKNKHPHTLAYEKAIAALKIAKQLHRTIALYKKTHRSIVNFEVLGGSQLKSSSPIGKYRPTLKPYMVRENGMDGWSLPLQRLIDHRWELRHIPVKRLHELQNLYDTAGSALPSLLRIEDDTWDNQLKHLLDRIGLRSGSQTTAIQNALIDLGGLDGWLQLQRHGDSEDSWFGHGLPDLLDAWDYAFSLDRSTREYEEG